MKKLIKTLTPSFLINIYRKYNQKQNGWHGDYKDWRDAENNSTGYQKNDILEKVRNSLIKVKTGQAVYERDGILFDKIQYSWPLLAGLMYASAKLEGTIKVLDFGGSLGSTYFQNKKFLDQFREVSWTIVEQKHFVEAGKKDFENEKLKFYDSTDLAIEKESPNTLLLLSVLQYIENPYELLEKLVSKNFNHIIIDRTPFSKSCEKIKLQIVPSNIYKASYPCWFFDELKFIRFFEDNKYRVVETFLTDEIENDEYVFKGFIISKKC